MKESTVTLTKWGNGRGVLLPKEMCDAIHAEIGDSLTLVLDENHRTIHLEPTESFTLESLMAGYSGPPPGEIDAPDSSTGNEMW